MPICLSRLSSSAGVQAGTLCTAGQVNVYSAQHDNALQGVACQAAAAHGCQPVIKAPMSIPGSVGCWWKAGEAQESPTAAMSVLKMRSRLAVLGLPA